jgi:hypothetical protein
MNAPSKRPPRGRSRLLLGAAVLSALFSAAAMAHGVAEADAAFLERVRGIALVPFM